VTGAGRYGCDAAFEAGEALLQHIGRRVHDARVDVAQFLQGEEVGGVFGVAELVARRLVDRHGAAARCRVGRLAGVKLAGVEAKLSFTGHGSLFLFTCLLKIKTSRLVNERFRPICACPDF